MERSRVPLPAGVRPPVTVYVNGVRQEPGTDYELRDGTLVFTRRLVQEERLGFWKWLRGAFGIGSYDRNDVVDVAHADGLAHALTVAPDA